jgi:hypothetical protein
MPWSAKTLEDKIRLVEQAWANLAPDRSFGGLSLEQFRAAIKPSQDARSQIGALENQLRAVYSDRDDADEAASQAIVRVVNGVRADPEAGDDSPLYEAMGYVRKSERHSTARRSRKEVASVTA